MKVGPEDLAVDPGRHVQHVVMVVPVDPQVDEAEDVGEEDRHERREGAHVVAVRDLQLQHQDGDEDGDDAVAEGLHPCRVHRLSRSVSSAFTSSSSRAKSWTATSSAMWRVEVVPVSATIPTSSAKRKTTCAGVFPVLVATVRIPGWRSTSGLAVSREK